MYIYVYLFKYCLSSVYQVFALGWFCCLLLSRGYHGLVTLTYAQPVTLKVTRSCLSSSQKTKSIKLGSKLTFNHVQLTAEADRPKTEELHGVWHW